MFNVPIHTPPTELIAWYAVNLNRLIGVVEVFYGRFASEAEFQEVNEPPAVVPIISIRGQTVKPLLRTTENRLYDEVRSLIGRLLTGTATEQEQADVSGWQALAQAVLVPGVTHLDPSPFPLGTVEEPEQ